MVNKRKAERLGKFLGVDFETIPLEQFRRGIGIESNEHRDVVHGNSIIAAKLAYAHLRKYPEYYTMMSHLESQRIAARETLIPQ